MDTHTSSRRALKLAQKHEVTGDWRWPRNERHLDVLPLRDFGTKERESKWREVVLGTLLKLLVKDKLLHSGKVSVNAELRPEEREMRNGSSAIQHFEQGDEDVDGITFNFYTGLPRIYFPIIHSYHCPRET